MKSFSAVLAVTALAVAGTVAMAQQPPPPAEPPASTAPQDQTPSQQDRSPNSSTTPSDPSASPTSESRQQTLMKECMSQVAAANPGLAQKDIQNFCDKEVNQAPPQG